MDIPLDLGLSNLGEILGLSPSPKDAKIPSGSAVSPRKTFDIQEVLPTPPQLKDLRKQFDQPTQTLPLMVPNLGSPIQQTKATTSAPNSPSSTPRNTVRFDETIDETKQNELYQVWGWVENYQCMFQFIIGFVIILYGHFFPMTLLVVQGLLTNDSLNVPHFTLLFITLILRLSCTSALQAMAITGGPKLQRSFSDLYKHYKNAKQIFEDTLPEFRLSQGIFPLF